MVWITAEIFLKHGGTEFKKIPVKYICNWYGDFGVDFDIYYYEKTKTYYRIDRNNPYGEIGYEMDLEEIKKYNNLVEKISEGHKK